MTKAPQRPTSQTQGLWGKELLSWEMLPAGSGLALVLGSLEVGAQLCHLRPSTSPVLRLSARVQGFASLKLEGPEGKDEGFVEVGEQ